MLTNIALHVACRTSEELLLYIGAKIGYWRGDIKGLVDDIGGLPIAMCILAFAAPSQLPSPYPTPLAVSLSSSGYFHAIHNSCLPVQVGAP